MNIRIYLFCGVQMSLFEEIVTRSKYEKEKSIYFLNYSHFYV